MTSQSNLLNISPARFDSAREKQHHVGIIGHPRPTISNSGRIYKIIGKINMLVYSAAHSELLNAYYDETAKSIKRSPSSLCDQTKNHKPILMNGNNIYKEDSSICEREESPCFILSMAIPFMLRNALGLECSNEKAIFVDSAEAVVAGSCIPCTTSREYKLIHH